MAAQMSHTPYKTIVKYRNDFLTHPSIVPHCSFIAGPDPRVKLTATP